MSQDTSLSRASGSPGMWLSRVARLAQKELRETLRDRRTIITLILMPILVYPVLSVALRQFLVSSTTAQAKQIPLNIATETDDEWRILMLLLKQGDTLLHEQAPAATSAPLTGGPIFGADLGASELPLQENHIVSLGSGGRLEDFVRNNEIDLGVRLLPPDNTKQGRADAQFQFIYRPNMPLSRQAANFVERRLQAVNEHDLRQRLEKAGDRTTLRAAWRLVPVAEEKGHSFWLGALVPLVLILMTITGAVYPAIDLTAGERERGTLEALMAAPVPRLSVLVAKYVAVVVVATMTAVINLTAMIVTLASSGKELWTFFFGDQGSPVEAIFAVLLLLVLFSMFFAAVLLLVTSFARSFKEAQAYVVPLMVVCLAPGFMSVMPGLELDWLMSVVPLANIVLLARDVLEGDAPLLWGAVAVISTIVYGGLALALAACVFGSDAILYGSEGSWSDLLRRPRALKLQPTITDALTGLAVVMPAFIVGSGLLSFLGGAALASRLWAGAGVSLLIFVVLPLLLARAQGVALADGFQLHRTRLTLFAAAAVLGATLWPLAYDLIIFCRDIGIATLSKARVEEHRAALEAMVGRLRALPPATVLLAIAVVPAIGEEFFFRGYLLGSLRGRLPAWLAISLVGFIFGLFHASVFGLIAVERVASSTLLGIALGWLCWQTRSIFPGMLLHAINNSLLIGVIFFAEQLKDWGYDAEKQRYLPLPLLVTATLIALAAILFVAWQSRPQKAVTDSRLAREPEPLAEVKQTAGSNVS